jgi:hypothetical protein
MADGPTQAFVWVELAEARARLAEAIALLRSARAAESDARPALRLIEGGKDYAAEPALEDG